MGLELKEPRSRAEEIRLTVPDAYLQADNVADTREELVPPLNAFSGGENRTVADREQVIEPAASRAGTPDADGDANMSIPTTIIGANNTRRASRPAGTGALWRRIPISPTSWTGPHPPGPSPRSLSRWSGRVACRDGACLEGVCLVTTAQTGPVPVTAPFASDYVCSRRSGGFFVAVASNRTRECVHGVDVFGEAIAGTPNAGGRWPSRAAWTRPVVRSRIVRAHERECRPRLPRGPIRGRRGYRGSVPSGAIERLVQISPSFRPLSRRG